MASKRLRSSQYIVIIPCLAPFNSSRPESRMSVNSELKAQRVTEADHRTLSYVNTLADSIFAPEYKAFVLVHPSYFDPDDYFATLIARSTVPDSIQPKIMNVGMHAGTTREEALLGLLEKLERMAVEKSQKNSMEYWEECYKTKLVRQKAEEQAAREATIAEVTRGMTHDEKDMV